MHFLFRWLSHRDFLSTFLENYDKYLEIRDEEPSLFSLAERRLLDNRQVKEGAKHMLEQLDIIANGLNIMQSDSTHLGDAMKTWLHLTTSDILTDELKATLKERMKKTVTPFHMLASIVMNKDDCDLSSDQKQCVLDHLEEIDVCLPGMLAAFQMKDTSVFPSAAFKQSIKAVLEPTKYWQFVRANTSLEPLKLFCDLAGRVLSCPPSSAGL